MIPFVKAISLIILISLFIYSCSPTRTISRSAKNKVVQNKALETAHIGISIYDPASGKYLYNYQGDKYFVPASNTKIPTCYAAMKYLGDSLVGLRIGVFDSWLEDFVIFEPTADPTFLHPSFPRHPSFDYLYQKVKEEGKKPGVAYTSHEFRKWGNGWSWTDYDAAYMAERSPMAVAGNTIHIRLIDSSQRVTRQVLPSETITPKHVFTTGFPYFDSLLNNRILVSWKSEIAYPPLTIYRRMEENYFVTTWGETAFRGRNIPFVTNGINTALRLLSDTLGSTIELFIWDSSSRKFYMVEADGPMASPVHRWIPLYSHPTDSLLKPMMKESDNFFAEQSLLMVSKERLSVMNDAAIIDTLLKTDFNDLPHIPRWVDGSGLSRYNLFTPQDMVIILKKMKDSFGMERIRTIFPTGNEGTLRNYYRDDSTYIYAKTGTLSGVVALSGFLYTKKSKLLIFSILVNNHRSDATTIRRQIEAFIKDIRQQM